MKQPPQQKEYLTFPKACKYLNIYKTNLEILIIENYFPGIIIENKVRLIPLNEIDKFIEEQKKYISLQEVVQLLNYRNKANVLYLINTNKLPKYDVIGGIAKFQRKIINEFKEKFESEKRLTCTIKEAMELLNFNSSTPVIKMISNGELPNARMGIYREWRIPFSDIDNYKKYLVLPTEVNKEIINEKEAIVYLEFSNKSNLLTLLNNNTFPSAYKESDLWRIHKHELDSYLDSIKLIEIETKIDAKVKPEPFNMLSLEQLKSRIMDEFNITELNHIISQKEVNHNNFSRNIEFLRLVNHVLNNLSHTFSTETIICYLQFCRIQVNNLSGTVNYNLSRVRTFIDLFSKLNEILNVELTKIPQSTLSFLIGHDSILSVHQRKIFSNFLNFYYDSMCLIPTERIYFSYNKKEREKEIYSPEQFNILYEYAINYELHVSNAITSRNYANMWVYVLLLLTDFIRGQDIIDYTPTIKIEPSKIDSISWLNKQRLDQETVNKIINQVYAAFRHKRSNKTNELLTFVLSPDITYSLATSLIISEFHRREAKAELQLDSFMEGKYRKIRTEGKISHQKFFDEMKGKHDFTFGSRKMNNSVATYLFYSITEADGYDSDLALHLTQVARSHKSPETTSIYIQATNKDGSINKVAYNLFKRGHFGWLYDHLLRYYIQFENPSLNMSEKTNLIENMRNELTLINTELIAEFVTNSLSNSNKNNFETNFEFILDDINKKRQSVIQKLSSFSKEEISSIIKKLACSELPSKDSNAQCLIYPKCNNPNLKSCYSCEFVIPGNLFLIQLNTTINDLINEIESINNEILLMKSSKFLLLGLFIWKEARLHYGETYVNGYISFDETKSRLNEISNKIVLNN